MGQSWFDDDTAVALAEFTPREYQQDAFDAVLAEEQKGIESTFVVLPTGTGKTNLMTMLAKHRYESRRFAKKGRTLILGQTDEIVGQCYKKLEENGLDPALEKASSKAFLEIQDAANDRWSPREVYSVVGSVQTMHKRRLERYWPKDYFDLILVDECHHGLSPSYLRIFAHFNTAYRVGVTATGGRLKPKKARKVFRTKAHEYPLAKAIEQGYVKDLSPWRSPEKVDLSGIEIEGDEFSISQLADRISPEIERLANSVREQIGDRQTIVFTPQSSDGAIVTPAQIWAEALKKCNIRAESISGKSGNRSELLQRFRHKEIQVLVCCQLLGEGYDNPSVSCIVLARPVLSSDFGYQMIGRGLRPYEEFDDCLIIDFTWATDCVAGKIFRPIHIFGDTEGISDRQLELAEKLVDDGDVEDLKEAVDIAEEMEKIEVAKMAAAKKEEQRIRDLKLNVKVRKSNMKFEAVDLEASRNFADWLIDTEVHDNFLSRRMPVSDKQRDVLLRLGITEDELEGVTRRKVSSWLDWMSERRTEGLATYKQVKRIINWGVPREDALRYTFDQASQFIGSRIARGRRR